MKNNTLKSFVVVAIISFHFFSCNAPHNNPLDPNNPDNGLHSIEGNVKTVKLPRLAIPGVDVFWANESILTSTANDGYFALGNISQIDGWLYFQKSGYSYDSVYVSWGGSKKMYIEKYLNADPQLDSISFYSIVLNKWPNSQKYSLEIHLGISDEENDVDSVFIEYSNLAVRNSLEYNSTSRLYEKNLDLDDLKLTSIDDVIGKEFSVVVYDIGEKKYNIGRTNIKRIIKQEVILDSPANLDTVRTEKVNLKWRRFTPGFMYNYFVQIYTDEVPAELVWEKSLKSDGINYEVDKILPPGDYFWVMWAVDEFNNRCRSKPASFIKN